MNDTPSALKPKVLIVEDNPDTRRFLEAMLAREFTVITAENAIIGIELARNEQPQIILLDIMLPILSGYDACSLLKKDDKTKRIPIIFLSAKNTVTDITQGLTTGADDYIPKPFDYKELLARIKVRLRQGAQDDTLKKIEIGDLKIDPNTREVLFKKRAYSLTLTEYDLLRHLAQKEGIVVSREEILKDVWKEGGDSTSDRTIDVHIRSLRKKMPELTKHIISIYGVGYKYEK